MLMNVENKTRLSLALQASVWATLFLVLPAVAQEPITLPANLKLLQEFEIAPTKESVADYLISLYPSPQEREMLEKLVEIGRAHV